MNILNIDKDIISKDEIKELLTKVVKPVFDEPILVMGEDYFSKAVIGFDDRLIIDKILKHTNDRYNINLKCLYAQLQTWVPGSYSKPHIHRSDGIESGDYNIIVYLNDDYEGGEFFLQDYNVTIKPVTGMSVIFNGRDIYHGVTKIEKSNRYGLIIWCKSI